MKGLVEFFAKGAAWMGALISGEARRSSSWASSVSSSTAYRPTSSTNWGLFAGAATKALSATGFPEEANR